MGERFNDTTNRNSDNKPLDLFGRLEQFQGDHERLKWEGSFREYLDKVVENPNVARPALGTVYKAFISNRDYFTSGSNALYGAEGELEQLENFLKAGNEGLQLGKRILLMVGGPGSGKSTAARGLKELVEAYSKTDDGALYAIKDCELHEEPLHLIPRELRPELETQLGIRIEGDLCASCKLKHGQTESLAQVASVPIERIFLSEQNQVGISSFEPSDTKSQDISELIGEIDLSKLGEYGVSDDPRAFRFNGAFHKSNRGILELVELLKNDDKFMYAFLSAAQERVVKSKSFPYTSIDEMLLAHTNLAEYDRYMSNDKNEAIRDRTMTIWWKYPLRVQDEKKVYEKLVGEGELVRKKSVHVNPNALETAAYFSVLSRLVTPKKLSHNKLQKMMAYDGKDVEGISREDMKQMALEFPKEGLSGVSPRFVIDSLSSEIVKEGVGCLTPLSVIRALRSNIDRHPHTREMKPDEKEALENDLKTAQSLYGDIALEEIKSAYLGSREEEIAAYIDKYLQNVAAFCSHSTVADDFHEDGVEPDEEFMRSIESQLGVAESGKKEHRTTLLAQIFNARTAGREFDLKTMPKLRRAISNKLFSNIKDEIRLVTSARVPDEKQRRRIDEMKQTLIDDRGYCDECAKELLNLASTLLNKKD